MPITTSHKHLCVTFSNDAKWNIHVDNIKSSVSIKHFNILRKLKYRLSRTNLDKLYIVYIRPLFEYACELWDNGGIGNSQKLEQLQLPELLQAYLFDTFSKFKSELKKMDEAENHSIPKHFFGGPRKFNIILTQLRNSASLLNFDLFRVGIVSDPSCRCGAALENLKHFFLDCPIYIQARTILIGTINRDTTCYTLDIELLTCGNGNLTDEQNCIIFKYVFDYIKCSKRFLIV